MARSFSNRFVVVALGSLSVSLAGGPAEARQRTEPASQRALAAFEQIRPGAGREYFDQLRPDPLPAHLRDQVIASLPPEGEVRPSAKEARKLAAIEPVLRYHQRQDVLQLKLITVGHAFVGLHARTVLLVSREALDLIDIPELQALVAHEVGHEYVWDEYQAAVAAADQDKVRELELRCDGVAVITLRDLGLDARPLVSAVKSLTRFNERVGAVASASSYSSLKDRVAFIETVDRLSRARSEVPVTGRD
jgi:hypothetical protein